MTRAEESGKRIKRLRVESGMSQADLAEKAGTTTSAIGNYELGLRIPKDHIKIKIAQALGVSVEAIFFA